MKLVYAEGAGQSANWGRLGVIYIHLHLRHQQWYIKMFGIFGDWTPVYTSKISIFAKLILILRFLGGN